MYISRIVIRNFRNIQHLDVSLRDGITTVIGENNTGKTNIMHAVRLALDADLPAYMRQLTPSDVFQGVAAQHPLQVLVSLEFRNFEDNVEASAFAAFLKVDEDFARITYRFRPDAGTRDSIEADERNPPSLSYDDYRWEISGGRDADPATLEWNSNCGQNIRYSDLVDYLVVFLHALRDAASDLKTSRMSPLRRLLRTLDISSDEQTRLLTILENANAAVTSTETIRDIGVLLHERLSQTAGDAFRLDVSLGMASPTFFAIERTLTVLLTSSTHTAFEPTQNGLGLNNVLYVAILLQYFQSRLASGSVAGSLLLVEEPEAHLHPQLEKVLFETLRAHGVQVLVTTHSSHIASCSAVDDIVILTTTSNGAVHGSAPRSNPQLNDTDRADIERYLDATKSTLLFARRVILVEGPAELFVIPPLVKAVRAIDLDRHGVAVIPIFGTHFEQFAKLFGPDAIHKRCAIVTDRDEAGDGGDTTTPPRGLDAIENEYVKVFSTPTTFERALAVPGLLPALRGAAVELNARTLLRAIDDGDLDAVAERTLAIASNRSKGRFGQVLSRHVHQATELPEYLRDAVDWICA